MGTKRALPIWCVGLLAACVLTRCGGAGTEPGSEADLGARIEAIALPAGMTELDRLYNVDCDACPSLVVWYRVTVPAEELRLALVAAAGEAGWDVTEGSASVGVFSAGKDDHMLFVVLDTAMIARNPHAPPGTGAEISVHPLEAVRR